VGRVGTVNAGRLAAQKHAASLENRAQFSHKTELELLYAGRQAASVRFRPQLAPAPASAGAFCFRFLQRAMRKSAQRGRTTDFPTLRHVVGIGRWCSQRLCLRRPVPNGERPKQARHFGLDIRVSGPSFLPVTLENVDSTNHDMQRMSFTMAHGRTNAFGLRLR